MKKNIFKLLSVFLVFIIVFSGVNVNAFAAGIQDNDIITDNNTITEEETSENNSETEMTVIFVNSLVK